jgi:hypothetical protein
MGTARASQFPTVTFTPEETVPLTFQGRTVQAYAGVPLTCPSCFKEIYDKKRSVAQDDSKSPGK